MTCTDPTLVGWMFEHPFLTFFVVVAALEALSMPFRVRRGGDR